MTLFPLLLLVLPVLQDRPDDRYQYVAGLYEKGLHELAAKEAEKLLRDEPRHPRADYTRYRLGASLFELGKKDEALPYLRTLAAKEGFEFQAEAAFREAQCEMAAGRDAQAVKELERVLALGKEYLKPHARFLLGETAFRAADYKGAQARFAEVLRGDTEKELARSARLRLAWCAYHLGDHKSCLDLANAVLRESAGEEEAHFLIGEVQLETGKPREALASYRRVVKGSFADAALRGAGFAYAANDRHREAAGAFGELIERFPKSRFTDEAALHCGIELLKAGDPAAAISALEARRDPDHPDVAYWRAQAELKAGKPEAALAVLDRALKAKPPRESADKLQAARGEVLVAMGAWGDAQKAFRQSSSDFGLHAAVIAALNAGKTEEAVALAKSFLERFEKSAYRKQVLLALGEAQLAAKRPADAEPAFASSLESGLDGAEKARALSGLAWCRYLQNDPAGALARFGETAKAQPDSPQAAEARYMIGRCHEAAGNKEKAAAAWKSYLELHPSGAHRDDARLGLARVDRGEAGLEQLRAAASDPKGARADEALVELAERQYAAGRKDEAEASYRSLLERFPSSPRVPAAHYGLAWILYERDRFADARAMLDGVAGHEGASPELRVSALELLVWCERMAKRPDGAAGAYRLLRKACSDEERCLAAAKAAAAALTEAGRAPEAERLLESLSDAKNPKVRSELAAALADAAVASGDLARAQKRLDGAPSDAAASGEARFRIGEAYFEKGDDEKAASQYRLAAAAPSVSERALYKEGFAWLRKGENAKAASCFTTLTESNPTGAMHGEGLFLLGEALFRSDRFAEAVPPLEKARREAPPEVQPKVLFRLGLSLARLERWKGASDALGELAQRFPDFENGAEAELERGRALAALSNPRAARQALDRVVARDHGVLAARARLELGRLHLTAGDHEAALAEFLKVSLLFGHDEEVAEGLLLAAACLDAKGDRDQAARLRQEVLDKHPSSKSAAAAREQLRSNKPR